MRARQAFAVLLAAFFPALTASAVVGAVVPDPLLGPLAPVALALGLSPGEALAQAPSQPSQPPQARAAHASDAGADKKYDPLNQTAVSLYVETCLQGNAKYAAKELPAAIELYRRAITLAPKNALAHYLLGEALLASGSPSEAETVWKTAEESTDDRNPNLRGRVLFVLADLKERQKKWDEAKAAWQVYGDYAAKHADAGTSAQTAISRTQAIDDMLKQDKLYEVVRQRINAEKDAGASPAGADAGAAKK